MGLKLEYSPAKSLRRWSWWATRPLTDRPAVIPVEHSAKLIALGYMADLSGRLRMTAPGQQRMAAGFENGEAVIPPSEAPLPAAT